jgi:peptidoglycan hydrolase-like protein with peptidoglycan-binding domain
MTILGYYSGPIDGVYGRQTTTAVEAMQEDLGVTPDGIYGPETHTALKDKATSITVEIQTVLAEYGYTGTIDGVWGPKTKPPSSSFRPTSVSRQTVALAPRPPPPSRRPPPVASWNPSSHRLRM